MTNLGRIRKMKSEELAELFTEVRRAPGFEYIDFDGWLKSSSPEWIYKGYPGIVTDHNGVERSCIVVGSKMIYSRAYKTVIADGQLMQVPKDQVRAAEKEKD